MSLRVLELDFVAGSRQRPAWHVLALVAGLAACAAAAVVHLDVRSTSNLLQKGIDSARGRQQQVRLKEISPQQLRALQERAAAVNRQIEGLNVPWGTILRTMQPPSDIQVSILSIDATGQADGLKIAALAERPEEMTDYVAYLSDKHRLRDTYLVRHELTAEGKYRFDVESAWRASR